MVIRSKQGAATPASTAMPYLGDGGAALTSATLDFGTVRMSAILDSGNDAPIILPSAYRTRLALEEQPVVAGYAVSAAGGQPITKARLAGSVRIAGVALTKPEVYFMDGGRPNIGLLVLRRIKSPTITAASNRCADRRRFRRDGGRACCLPDNEPLKRKPPR